MTQPPRHKYVPGMMRDGRTICICGRFDSDPIHDPPYDVARTEDAGFLFALDALTWE